MAKIKIKKSETLALCTVQHPSIFQAEWCPGYLATLLSTWEDPLLWNVTISKFCAPVWNTPITWHCRDIFHKVTELTEAQNPRHTFSGNFFPQCFWSYIKTIYSTLRKLPSSFLNHKIFKSQPTGKQNAAEEMQFSEREAQRTRLTRLSTCPTWESKAKVSNRENLWCRPQVDLLGVTSQTGLLHLCLRPQSPTERSWPLDTENPDTK